MRNKHLGRNWSYFFLNVLVEVEDVVDCWNTFRILIDLDMETTTPDLLWNEMKQYKTSSILAFVWADDYRNEWDLQSSQTKFFAFNSSTDIFGKFLRKACLRRCIKPVLLMFRQIIENLKQILKTIFVQIY